MKKTERNKQFYRNYLKALSGKKKTREMLEQYIEDERLIQHALFLDQIFPGYELVVDELLAEGDKIFVRSHMVGEHLGAAEDIPATHKTVKAPFALGYTIKNDKIVNFWAIANEMELFEQLGLAKEQVEVVP